MTMTYLLPESGKPLLLGVSVDVCANNKGNDVEEWYPRLFGQEFLGESKSKG